MRLEEFDGTSAAERRVNGLKANADAAKRQAKQLKANADLNAERLKMRQSRETLAQLRKTSAMSTVKPRR